MPWQLCKSTSAVPFGTGWWTGHRWRGPGRRWPAQRWTECGWVSGTLSPPGLLGRTSTTHPAGSTESSRRWKTRRSRCSFLEFSSGLWGCCSWNTANALHLRELGVQRKKEKHPTDYKKVLFVQKFHKYLFCSIQIYGWLNFWCPKMLQPNSLRKHNSSSRCVVLVCCPLIGP